MDKLVQALRSYCIAGLSPQFIEEAADELERLQQERDEMSDKFGRPTADFSDKSTIDSLRISIKRLNRENAALKAENENHWKNNAELITDYEKQLAELKAELAEANANTEAGFDRGMEVTGKDYERKWSTIVMQLKELAAPKAQEPVAYYYQHVTGDCESQLCFTRWIEQHRNGWVEQPLFASPQPTAVPGVTKELLTDLFAEMLVGTYHCGRVWHAWDVGTMGEDDFSPVEKSNTPAELADAVLAMLFTASQPTAVPKAKGDPDRIC